MLNINRPTFTIVIEGLDHLLNINFRNNSFRQAFLHARCPFCFVTNLNQWRNTRPGSLLL